MSERMRVIDGVEELQLLVGSELGVGEWLLVGQGRIDAFAESTEDRQWIHVDPERAAGSPFGGTIAHGYLTLALLPALSATAYRVDRIASRVNLGLDRVRFPAPVPSGSRIRNRAELVSAELTPRGLRTVIRNEVQIEGGLSEGLRKPACIADTVTLFVPAA